MQKKIIALAVVAAFSAPAFADTTVYGLLDGAVASLSNTGQRSQTLALSGGLASSRFGVKSAEDLGDGLTAVVNLEYSIDGQTNTGVGAGVTSANSTTANRQSLLGLAGSFGTVATGYLQTAGNDFAIKFDPTAGSVISPLQNLTAAKFSSNALGISDFLIGSKTQATRAPRAIAYISPDFNGFSFAVNYATAITLTVPGTGGSTTVGADLGNLTKASSAVDGNISATLFAANYTAGPLAVGGVYATTGNLTSSLDLKEYALGASYDLGVAKVYGTYQSTHLNGAAGAAGNNDKIYSLSSVIPAGGAGNVVVSYAHASIGTDTTGNSDANSYTAGLLHPLSKTTTAYVAYSHAGNGTGSAAVSVDNSALGNNGVGSNGTQTASLGASSNVVALGLQKKF